ncbi:hypothetical protein RB195_022710 [Necator americanus]|uniref:Uncharacterized protein n=1 Tax=Necator americanus TaxID=51031 RepID=A0ABR1EGJ6_NECAM
MTFIDILTSRALQVNSAHSFTNIHFTSDHLYLSGIEGFLLENKHTSPNSFQKLTPSATSYPQQMWIAIMVGDGAAQ